MTDDKIEEWCEVMHNAYEDAARSAGWETQERSRVPWSDVPEANKITMRAAVAAVEPLIRADERDRIIKQLQEVHRLDPWARRNVFAGVDLAIRMIKDTADD